MSHKIKVVEMSKAFKRYKTRFALTPVRVLANGGIFPGIFLEISVEIVLAGLREGYP